MRRLDCILDLKDMSLGKLRELVIDREAWRATVPDVTKNGTGLSELNWTDDELFLINIRFPGAYLEEGQLGDKESIVCSNK